PRACSSARRPRATTSATSSPSSISGVARRPPPTRCAPEPEDGPQDRESSPSFPPPTGAGCASEVRGMRTREIRGANALRHELVVRAEENAHAPADVVYRLLADLPSH